MLRTVTPGKWNPGKADKKVVPDEKSIKMSQNVEERMTESPGNVLEEISN